MTDFAILRQKSFWCFFCPAFDEKGRVSKPLGPPVYLTVFWFQILLPWCQILPPFLTGFFVSNVATVSMINGFFVLSFQWGLQIGSSLVRKGGKINLTKVSSALLLSFSRKKDFLKATNFPDVTTIYHDFFVGDKKSLRSKKKDSKFSQLFYFTSALLKRYLLSG